MGSMDGVAHESTRANYCREMSDIPQCYFYDWVLLCVVITAHTTCCELAKNVVRTVSSDTLFAESMDVFARTAILDMRSV